MKRMAAESSDWFVPFLALSATSLSGGPYGDVGRHLTGLIVWLAVLVLVGLLRWPRREPGRDAVRLGGAIAVFAALAALSMVWSESIERSYLEWTRGALHLGLFVLTVVVVARRGTARSIVDGLTLGAALTIALAALSRLEAGLFPASPLAREFPETASRLSYPFDYWNAVAALAAIAVPLIVYQAGRGDVSRLRRSVAAGFIPVLGLTIYMTSSRGGMLAAAVATLVLLALGTARWAMLRALVIGGVGTVAAVLALRSGAELNDGLTETAAARSQGHWVLAALIVIAAVCGLVAYAGERLRAPAALRVSPGRALAAAGAIALVVVAVFAFSGGFEGTSSERARGAGGTQARVVATDTNGRTAYWESSADAFADAPLGGHGAGTWEFWWRRNATSDAPARDAHSVVADAAATLGVLGLIGILVVLGGVLWAGVRRWRSERTDLYAALIGAALAFEISAVVDWTWKFPALAGTFFVVAGLLVARGPRPEPVTGEPGRRSGGAGLRAGVLVIAWIAVCTQATPLLAGWKLEQSRDAVKRGDLAEARNAAETARSIQPWATSADLQLAQVLEAQGNVAGARESALAAVDAEPKHWRNWFVLARIESRQPRGDQAIEYLKQARSLNPRSPIWDELRFSASKGALSRAVADPVFTADDELSSFRGGRRIFGDGARGSDESRELRRGELLEAPVLEGLTPGRVYELSFYVKPMTRGAGAEVGRAGDTGGGGWGADRWAAREPLRWQRASLRLRATAAEQRLVVLWYKGATTARVDAIEVRPAQPR